jgi:hypothetical protein
MLDAPQADQAEIAAFRDPVADPRLLGPAGGDLPRKPPRAHQFRDPARLLPVEPLGRVRLHEDARRDPPARQRLGLLQREVPPVEPRNPGRPVVAQAGPVDQVQMRADVARQVRHSTCPRR